MYIFYKIEQHFTHFSNACAQEIINRVKNKIVMMNVSKTFSDFTKKCQLELKF